MKRYHSFSIVPMLVVLMLLLNQCGDARQGQPLSVDEPGTVYKTDIETYYDASNAHWWYEDTVPLTITCELRDTADLVVASRTYTWTLSLYDGGPTPPTEPITIVETIPLMWELGEPLAPGLYEEWCRSELGRYVGSGGPGIECDARGFCLANTWRAPCIWGSFLRAVDK